MEFQKIVQISKELRDKYATIEIKNSGKPWGSLERTQGFVVDVGDLMKLVMAKNNLRHIEDVDNKLAHELFDCLWSVIIISDELGINLEEEFIKQADKLKAEINEEISA